MLKYVQSIVGFMITKSHNEIAEKVSLPLEKGGFRGIIELKSLLISL